MYGRPLFFFHNEKTPSFFSLSHSLVVLVFVVLKRKSSKVCVFVVRRSQSRLRRRLRQNGRLWVHHLSRTTTEKDDDGAVSGTVRERREFRRRRRPGSDVLMPNLVTTFNNRPKKGRGGQKSFGRRRTRWDSNSRSSAGSRGLFFQY